MNRTSEATDKAPVPRATLVLASGSPQRREILERLGIEFTVRPVVINERKDGDPEKVAIDNALLKAQAAAEESSGNCLILGVDTVVASSGRIFGKPATKSEAAAFLRVLSGKMHTVVSGLSVIDGGEVRSQACTSTVAFRELDEGLVDWYIATGEWRDRAGGYAIQGKGMVLVDSIDGDYLNIVGLPVKLMLDMVPGLIGR